MENPALASLGEADHTEIPDAGEIIRYDFDVKALKYTRCISLAGEQWMALN